MKATAAAGGASLALGRARERKTKVLFVLPDQLRRQALGCHGNQVCETPNMDRLAADGLRLERAVCAQPVCSAFRTQMQTGAYSHLVGVKLEPKSETLYRAFDHAGWYAGHIGKWHMTPGHLSGEPLQFVPPKIRPGVSFTAMHEYSHVYGDGAVYFLGDDREPISAGPWEPDAQTEIALGFLRERKRRDEPFFLTVS